MTGMEPLLIASMAMSAMGSIAAGNAARKAGNFNAAVGRENARAATAEGIENAERQRRIGARRQGGLRNEQVSLDVLTDQAAEEKLAELTILYGSRRKALALMQGASISMAAGKTGQRAGYMSAAGSLLKGASKLTPTPYNTPTPATIAGI
jgi:hypothetical protein